jgi:diguanylate cyclase (GGDEF)-like protein
MTVPGPSDILVVDDHEPTRQTLLDILAVAGFAARAAGTAADALSLQAAMASAVAVVDYQLPDATGLDVASRLKHGDPDLPVIVLTGNASLETAVAAVSLVDDYLTKPVAPEVLLRAVRAAAERRRLVVENRQLLVRLQEANATLEASVRERTIELHADRERLAEAQRIARLGSWEWDLRTKTLAASTELRRLLVLDDGDPPTGYDELFAHVLPEDLRFAEAHVHEAIDRLGPFTFEVRIGLADGTIRWLAVRGRVEVDEFGAAARLIGTSQDVTDRKRAEAQLSHQALHDQLTGLPNRALLLDRLDQALGQSCRAGRLVAVLFCDLDRFKLVNDSRGHAVGDDLLIAVADRLRGILRPVDTVARFGGDEFVMICHDAGAVDDVLHVAERVADALRRPFSLHGDDTFLSVSIGIAVSDGRTSAGELLRDADAAMYRAKDRGRARWEFFDDTMRTEAATRLETQSALHWAVTRNEMRVFYQPLVDVASGSPVGVEALVRWDHPTRGLVMPQEFVPLAEEASLIVPIGVSVLDQAGRQCARWQEQFGGPAFGVAVNLSVHHLRHPGLVEHVRSMLDHTGLDPACVCLELTESVLFEDADRHIRTLVELRSIGVRLAIDDFGTGYSSLTYLKQFPVDLIKIDRSFVAGVRTNASDTAIVRSVVELAHALGLRVVAEGVERLDQLEALRSFGCDVAQGFLFSPPCPPADIDAWLTAQPPAKVLTS